MAANDKFFADPDSRKVALGLQTGGWRIRRRHRPIWSALPDG
jgi:hypothetical protein